MRNLKKVIALVAVFAMLVSSVAFAGTFSDVADTDNYAKAIETLSALGIITGDDQDEDGVMDFRPEDTITRAEVTAIISRIQGINNAATTATEFTDVPATHWASGYVAQAAGQGIVNGYGDGTFGPEDNVLYEQMLKMLMETLGYRPFANDNGGYPTGYTTAASRYGVLEEVVGGGLGVEATRGMVAQMVYNAIDTPLMDATSYGDEKNFGFFDGTNRAYTTLLNRDLNMVKYTGVVTANSYSSGTIDTANAKEVTIKLANTDTNKGYYGGLINANVSLVASPAFYQGEVDADPYLGYAVEVYAKKNAASTKMTLVALSVSNTAEEITFTTDDFEAFAASKITYLNENEAEVNKTVDTDAVIIYNGVEVPVDFDNGETVATKLAGYLGSTGLIQKGGNLSGKVTMIDTDEDVAIDVVRIEIGVSGVVKEVTARGLVRVYNPIFKEAKTNAPIKLLFDEEDTTTIINLSKNGKAIDYTELNEWDVITVIWNGDAKVYDVRVLDETNYVDGSVSVVKSDGSLVLTNGETYELAANAYEIQAPVDPGTSGRFYIDAYGKIVALDDKVAVDGATAIVDNYAYVLKAQKVPGDWGSNVVQLMLLDKSGEIYEAELADKVKLVNFDQASYSSALATAYQTNDNFTAVMYEDATYIDDLDDFAESLVNTVISYEGNSAGEIKTVIVPDEGDIEADLAQIDKIATKTAVYNADVMNFSNTNANVTVNEDTYVFFIGGTSVVYGDDTVVADKDKCSVGKIGSLVDATAYSIVALAPDNNDEAQVLVLMNESGKVASTTSIAVIDSIGTSVVNGTDLVTTATFWLDGELKTATTKVDMDTANVIANAQQGDIVKVNLDGDTIVYAEKVMNFKADSDGLAYPEDATAAPELAAAIAGAGARESYYFGAITKISSNGTATVQPLDATGAASGAVKYAKEGTANVYVYDPEMKVEKRLSVGSLGDANVDEELAQASKTVKKGGSSLTTTPAYGMMDYVFVRTYDNVAKDIVVYRNFDFGVYVVE